MDVTVDIRYGSDVIDEAFVTDVCLFAMQQMDLPEHTDVSVSFVDNAEMAQLNEQYRRIEGPTDVLSFECDGLDDGFMDVAEIDGDGCDLCGSVYTLGDIVIAPDVAIAQAREYGNTANEELALLLVHGILHLCGYDHIEDADAEVMEGMQAEILNTYGKR